MIVLKKYLGFWLFIAAIFIAVITNNKYGISWDEEAQHEIGLTNYNYVFENGTSFLTFENRDYGVGVELPLMIVEKVFNINNYHDIYYTRHLLVHIFFLLGAFFCYLLIDYLYKNKLLASIGFLLIVLNPGIYGHSFFNSKDIPLLSMFIICFYLIAVAFDKKKTWLFIILGISVGYLINIRIIGGMLLFLVPLMLLTDLIWRRKDDQTTKLKYISLISLFLFSACFTAYATWPLLWHHPFSNLEFVVKNMSKFRWTGSVFFNGEMIDAKKVGWNYFFVWFGITNPITYLIFGILGILILAYSFIKSPLNYLLNTKNRNNLIYLICFISPIILILLLHSVIYDGWRHLYFVYPMFVLLIIFCINKLSTTKLLYPTYVCFGFTFIYVIYYMINNFPNQHVYFNQLVNHSPQNIRIHYEMDYWGNSYKQSLEYLLEHDTSDTININMEDAPGFANLRAMNLNGRVINTVNLNLANYYITIYRGHPFDYPEFKGKEYYSVNVANSAINTIFKIK